MNYILAWENSFRLRVYGRGRTPFGKTNSWAAARSGFQASDFIAGVDVRNPNSYMGYFGLIFGLSDDWKEFYTFEIRWPGWYSIWKYEAKSGWDLLAEGASSDINLFDATNHLELKRNGAIIEAYVNTHYLDSAFCLTELLGRKDLIDFHNKLFYTCLKQTNL